MHKYKNVDIEVKNKYILIVARRNDLNDNMKVKAFKANMNNKNNKNNKLLAEQAALIDYSVLYFKNFLK